LMSDHGIAARVRAWLVGCLHDPANVQQTSSKCIENTRANAGRLLEVCWKFAGRLLDRVTLY